MLGVHLLSSWLTEITRRCAHSLTPSPLSSHHKLLLYFSNKKTERVPSSHVTKHWRYTHPPQTTNDPPLFTTWRLVCVECFPSCSLTCHSPFPFILVFFLHLTLSLFSLSPLSPLPPPLPTDSWSSRFPSSEGVPVIRRHTSCPPYL